MTVRTVELSLDPVSDAAVRAVWSRLHAAGLKSLATHRHPTNRPHVTLTVTESLVGLPRLGLPVPIRLGPVRVLGRALVWSADGAALRELQAEVWSAVSGANPLHAPESWVAHVSLALNMPVAQHAAALELLAELPPMSGECVAARSYDTETREVAGLS